MRVDEEHAEITKKQKLKSCTSPRPHLPSSSRTVYNFTYLGIINNIELGGDWIKHYSLNFQVRTSCVMVTHQMVVKCFATW